jgi:outer membrane protein assembly factor BamB
MPKARQTAGPARRGLRAAVLATSVLGAALAIAQDQPDLLDDRPVPVRPVQQPGALDPNSFYGKDSTEGVYVRDSALALEKFALAQKMERLKEWNKSADLYQEILEKYSDRVVPSQIDRDNKIYQYTSVTKGVQEQLARWPQEGRDVYRARYEAAAAAMIESAGRNDLVALNQVFSKYFITDAAKQAGLRLVELNTERGEFLSAAEKGDRLLEGHPTVDAERPALLFRVALAYHLAGDDQRAMQRLDRLKRDHPQDVGTVRGKEVVLATALDAELKAPVEAAAGAAGDAYPMFGGDASRGRVSAANVSPGAPLFDVPLVKPAWDRIPVQHRQNMEQALAMSERDGLTLGVMPAVDRGELFFQDGRRVYAVSLASGGLPLAGWRQTYPGDRNGQYVLPGTWGSARNYQHTVTLTDTSLLAVMGQPDRRALEIGVQLQGETRLVCLDRGTGKENWVVAPSSLQLPKEAEAVRQLQFLGSPLVLGDAVLVAGRSSKPTQQFEDCWVVCFDLASGRYRWSSYVASSSAAGAMWGLQGGVAGFSDNATHLAYGDGRIYVMSNLGALAALDAYNGTILWLNIYPRNLPQGMDPNMGFNQWGMAQVQQSNRRPWTFNPVIVQQGKLFALPSDGRFLMVYDAASGVEVKRIRLSHLAEGDTLLGVFGDRLVVTGTDRIVCLNWPRYDAEKFNDDMLFWRVGYPGGMAYPVRGRGFVTATSVFIPAGDRLYRYDMKTGRAAETYPDFSRRWEKGSEGPGNVVATSDYVIIAGDQRVNVYTDLSAAKKRLDAEVAAAPGDPQPRLRYAGLLFAAGDSAAALGKLDEAVGLLGGMSAMASGPNRDQLFSDALTFAEKLSATGNADVRPRVLEMYARAAAAADSPAQQVRYRISRARLAETERDAPTSVELYQQILSDARLRQEPLTDDTTGSASQAGAYAERAIGNVIRLAGAGIYQKYQQAASDALAAAQQAGDPAKLLAVAQVYPNSTVAPQAMLAAADAYEAAADPKSAVNVLRPMYFKYPDSTEKPRIIEAMARNYLLLKNRRGNVDSAAARLAQGGTLPGDPKLTKPLVLPDGKKLDAGMPFAQALEEVRKYTGREAAKGLPDFRLPMPRKRTRDEKAANPDWPFLPPARQPVIADVTTLVLPAPQFARPDRLVTWTAGRGLSIYPAGASKPLGSSDSVAQQPQNLAWLDDDLLVWGAGRLALVPGAGGPAKWKLDVTTLPALEVTRLADAAATGLPGGMPNPPFGNVQVMVQGNRQFIIRNGMMQPLQPAPVAPPPAAGANEQVTDVRPVGDRVLVSTSTGRLLSAELPTGRVAWQTRLSDRALDRVVATEDFTVVRCSDENTVRLVVLDTFTGQHLGTKPFAVQPSIVPMNLAISADGTLVYTLPNALVLKDLYKPWADPASEKTINGPVQQPPYTGATRPDQLVIAEGRVLALADAGPQIGVTPDKYVRLHSLETGLALPLKFKTGKGDEEVDRVLTTGNKAWDVGLRVIGSHLYVVGSRAIVSYNLDRPAESWSTANTLPNATIRDAFVGQDFLAVLEQPDAIAAAGAQPRPPQAQQQLQQQQFPQQVPVAPPGAAQPPEPGQQPANVENAAADRPSPSYRLHIYGIYAVSEKNPAQSGRLDYVKEVADPAGITGNWQPIDGGFAYQTADGKVKMLLGARPEK